MCYSSLAMTGISRVIGRARALELSQDVRTIDANFKTSFFRMRFYAWNSDPAEFVIVTSGAIRVVAAIAALPEGYCIVAALYFVEELPYQEIADIVAGSMETVCSGLHRGRLRLQKTFWRMAEDRGVIARLRPDKESYGANR
jgi:DNA-directed RNA polymerase specialized sigma24 family protein